MKGTTRGEVDLLKFAASPAMPDHAAINGIGPSSGPVTSSDVAGLCMPQTLKSASSEIPQCTAKAEAIRQLSGAGFDAGSWRGECMPAGTAVEQYLSGDLRWVLSRYAAMEALGRAPCCCCGFENSL